MERRLGNHVTNTFNLYNSRINENNGNSGGGLTMKEIVFDIASTNVTANEVTTSGGGIYIESSNGAIVSTIITQNKCQYFGGGIYQFRDSIVTVSSSTITFNTAVDGAGICIRCSFFKFFCLLRS